MSGRTTEEQERFVLTMAQQQVAAVLVPGDIAIDTTVGNGHDTLFLAQQVGHAGKVYGFDIQKYALDKTRQRLQEALASAQVSLYHIGHKHMAKVVSKEREAEESLHQGSVKVVMFNLGYLPGGGNKHLTTKALTTLAALRSAAQYFLAPSGIISLIAYTGHPGGRQEAEQIQACVNAGTWLSDDLFDVSWHRTALEASSTNAPELLLIRRL